MSDTSRPPVQRSEPTFTRRTFWFVMLWVAGVVGAFVVAMVFKALMLGAVRQ